MQLSGQDADVLEKKLQNAPKPIYVKKTLVRKQSTPGIPDTPKLGRQTSMLKPAPIDNRPKSLSVANLEKVDIQNSISSTNPKNTLTNQSLHGIVEEQDHEARS